MHYRSLFTLFSFFGIFCLLDLIFDFFDHWSIFFPVTLGTGRPPSQAQMSWRDSHTPYAMESLSCERGNHG